MTCCDIQAVKAGKATGANLKVLFETQHLFANFADNIKRVAEDLANANADVQRLIADVTRSTSE